MQLDLKMKKYNTLTCRRLIFSSVQHVANAAISSDKFHDESSSAGASRAAAVCSESAVVVDAGLRQWQSAEERVVERRS